MKKSLFALGLVAGLSSFAGAARAADAALTVGAGTTGFGVHLSMPVQEGVNARVGLNFLNREFTGNTDDADYDFKMKLKTVDALLDWFPFGGAFRLTTGVVSNGNKIDAVAKLSANGTYTFGGNTYSGASAGRIDGNVRFKKVVPYLGFGWGNAIAREKGWGMSSDFGVLFQGQAETTLSNSGCTASAAMCAQLAADLAAENASLNEEVKHFKLYPVIRLGVSYKF